MQPTGRGVEQIPARPVGILKHPLAFGCPSKRLGRCLSVPTPTLMAVPDIQDDALPESLYHYTDAAGLLGILDNNSLYATHVAYLNDSQELAYGMQMAVENWRNG